MHNGGLLSVLRQITGLLRKLCRPAYIYRLRSRSWHFLTIVFFSRGLVLEVQTASVNLHCLICDMHAFCMHLAENLTSRQVLYVTSGHSECQAFIFVEMISQSFSILLLQLLNVCWGLFSGHSDYSAALQLN